jgi:beta-lactamase regulating signal transducer with metallopeptidase domain
MSLLNALGASPLLSLIGWTVVSAFTLGAAAAALFLLCRSLAPRLTAAWQHRLVLVFYTLSLACAFAVAAVPRKPMTALAPSQPMFGLPVGGALIPAPPGPSALTTNTSRVDLRVAVQEAVGVLAVLSIGMGALALGRLFVGLWLVRGLKRSAMPVADADVLAMVDSLAGRMRIRRRITLRESPEVDTAMTGGWLRPFVLLPPGMVGALGSEIEPVLAHELAHVRRRDFAVAVLQAVADAATRLSPGHRWLSLEASRIREQACDDVVVTLGVEPLRYARALEALGQWSRGVQVNQRRLRREPASRRARATSPRGLAEATHTGSSGRGRGIGRRCFRHDARCRGCAGFADAADRRPQSDGFADVALELRRSIGLPTKLIADDCELLLRHRVAGTVPDFGDDARW